MLKVQFDRPEATYFTTSSTGDVIKGILLVTLNSEMKMKGITVSINGYSRTSWSEGMGDDKEDFSAFEEYLNEKFPFLQSGYSLFARPWLVDSWFGEFRISFLSKNEMTLQPGTYEYPFECVLLPNLPSSFDGLHGHVDYYVKAKISRTGLKRNVTELFPFIVVQKLNLNLESGVFKEPYEHADRSEVKYFNCWFLPCSCWSIGTVSANFTLNKRCFVPGETVYVSGQIINNMSKDMKCKFSLTQIVEYHSTGITTTWSYTEIVSAEHGTVSPRDTDVWTNVPLLVPALPPSRLDGCKIIDIKYYVQCHVEVGLSGWSCEAEILIGSVPLGQVEYDCRPSITLQPTAVQFNNSPGYFK